MPLDLAVEVEESDGSIIVSDSVTLCYGHGATRELALADYLIGLGEWVRLTHKGQTDNENELDGLLLERATEWIMGNEDTDKAIKAIAEADAATGRAQAYVHKALNAMTDRRDMEESCAGG